MPDHYDRLENRTPSARETALFRDLRHLLGIAKARVPALRTQLKGIDVASLHTRADLAAIPVLRAADLLALQADSLPFGGLVATRVAALRQVFGDHGSLCALEGQAKDWWGCGRALYAAGARKGSVVLNCFSYDLVPHGHMIASGAQAIGAPVIPAGAAPIDAKLAAVERFQASYFCGSAADLKTLLDYADEHRRDVSSLENAVVTGPMSPGLRNEFSLRGVSVRQVWLRAELGVVAYESGAIEGMVVNEGLIVEFVEPNTGKPIAKGATGELVVSRISSDYPLLRFGTGEISACLPQPSTCGRTNMRIEVPRPIPRTVDRAHIDEIRKIHPALGRMQMFVRPRGDDMVHLRAEHRGESEAIEHVSATLNLVTRMRGTVEFVEPGTLSDDDAAVIHEPPLN